MFHLASGVALGVNIRNLLQLQRALKGDGVVGAAAEEEEVARVHVLAREFAQVAGGAQGFAHLERHLHEIADEIGCRPVGECAATTAEVDGKEGQGRELGGKALGRGNPDLRTGVGVEHKVRRARDGRIHHIADGHDGFAVAELAGQIDFARDARHVLDQEFAD